MSLLTGYILGSITVVLGACGLAVLALWLAARQVCEPQQASRSVIVRVDGYRARR